MTASHDESAGRETSGPVEASVVDELAWIRVVDGRLLLTRTRGHQAFCLPGGTREPGETDAQALSRVVRHQLGVDPDPATVRRVRVRETPAHGWPGRTVRLACCTGEATGSPAPRGEVEEIAWAVAQDGLPVSAAACEVLEGLAADGTIRESAPAPRAVLFDLDDTLLVTRRAKWEQSKFVARESFGFELTDAELEAAWGKPFETMIAEQYRFSAPVEELIAANDAQEANFPKTAVPGAPETVAALADAGYVLGVVTSTRTAKAREQLTRLGFPMPDFALVNGPEASRFHKPDGRVFVPVLEALSVYGITPAEVLYVGDSAADRAAALAAGLQFLAVATDLARDAVPAGHRVDVLDAVTALPARLADPAAHGSAPRP